MNDKFQENLAVGTEGEDTVYDYLRKHNSFVEDTRNQKHGEFGPRLRGTEGILVLPDFEVRNKNPKKGDFLVDVKVKTSLYTIDKKKCFTVDKKFEQYKRAAQVKKTDFLAIIFIYEGKLYLYKDSDVCGTTEFNNDYGKGTVYLFEFDEKKQIY